MGVVSKLRHLLFRTTTRQRSVEEANRKRMLVDHAKRTSETVRKRAERIEELLDGVRNDLRTTRQHSKH